MRSGKSSTESTQRDYSSGSDGAAIIPPDYGIDAANREPTNSTGLSDTLKAGVEHLSGLSLDDVQVHYNSSKPQSLQAKAYTQGSHIYVAPAQEQHVPHEAWHVVQQKQGRVQPTLQLQGASINTDNTLEQEASTMGAQALTPSLASAHAPTALATPHIHQPVIQGVFDWAIDAANARRKVGVEITESNAGGNGTNALQPAAGWGGLAPAAKNLLWTDAVSLPDANGSYRNWQVAAAGTMIPTHFNYVGGTKNRLMRWGSVVLTEDYGDFEWIVEHPQAGPMGITHYRDQLAQVSSARQELRDALNGLGLGNEFVLALNTDPVAGQVFHVNLQATDAASSQITFESTDRGQTKKALLEGLTHGLNKARVPNRASLVNADNTIATAVRTAAGRVAFPNADMQLIMAYIIGDLEHKIATLIDGPGWGGAIAANFKQWRTLFPKSHPTQILRQALNVPETDPSVAALPSLLAAVSANVIDDVTALFAQKLFDRTVRVEWVAQDVLDPYDGSVLMPSAFSPASDPHSTIFDAVTAGILPGGGLPALQAALVVFCQQNGVDLSNEYTNTVTALTDLTSAAVNVVRSTGFATHAPNTTGFAFEDRAEVQTQFPRLTSTYDRIKAIVNRY